MLQQDLAIIAGIHGGKRIRCKSEIFPIYQELLNMSRSGNYWAGLTIQGINNLTHGRLNNRNIFVRNKRAYTPPGSQHKDEFLVTLPGCSAVVEKMPNDEYVLNYMKLDTAYFDRTIDIDKPQLFGVRNNDNNWKAEINKDGQIKQKEERLVAITDSGHRDIDRATDHTATVMSKIPGETPIHLARHGFDMHYTPGESSFGGLINYHQATKPLLDSEASASALQLAKTMKQAKNTKYVQWVSEYGGSTVLTQAMAVLVDQGVTLPNHHVFMHRPKSVPNIALKLAHQLELKIGRDFKKSGMTDVIGNKGTLEMIYDRKMNSRDNYTSNHAAWDTVASAGNFYGVTKLAIGATAMPALLTATKAIGTALGIAKATEIGVAAVAPKFHEKLMSKFK